MKLLMLVFLITLGQADPLKPLPSGTYPWKGSGTIFAGSGTVLSSHVMKGLSLKSGASLTYKGDQSERFFIIKKGDVSVLLGATTYTIEKGSVIVLLPGDELSLHNNGQVTAELYEMMYASKTPADMARGKQAGGSFVMNWKDMVFKPHDKGGIRQLFDRKTVMFSRFDIHITTLNPGLSSHAPHTHKNEEIILMMDGDAEMLVNGKAVRCDTGDAVYVDSMVPHNLTNIGKSPSTYFAIQWN
jgi:(S)-ureidoglycine aminohydrolase